MPNNSKNKKATCIVGLQWGDEGKGKIVDFLSQKADMVVRYQGGSNAGHTVKIGDKEFIFHLIPTGILHKKVKCVIGQGVVFDPERFFEELKLLQERGIDFKENLLISRRAHVVFPYHRVLDSLREQHAVGKKIGTTARGIGPAYSDKAARLGIRVCDLIDKETFTTILKQNLKEKNYLIGKVYGGSTLSFKKIYDTFSLYGDMLAPLMCDCGSIITAALRKNKNVLFEGAQGVLLDIDNGTYPFVTSSNTGVDGIAAGAGVAPQFIGHVYGILKAYTTRVGGGPHFTEQTGKTGKYLREHGGEYGATTGRPRRCGWLDAVAARYAVDLNNVDSLILTKLDVLTGLEKIKIAVGYKIGGKETTTLPSTVTDMWKVKAVYIEIPGWQEDISKIRAFSELPKNAKNYIKLIEKLTGKPVTIVSIGSSREQVIER
ncbi:MAG: adenylosuccinate synthase [Planctomycetota bacterium]